MRGTYWYSVEFYKIVQVYVHVTNHGSFTVGVALAVCCMSMTCEVNLI